MEAVRDAMAGLLEQGLFDSAQSLGCFLVSMPAANNESSSYLMADALVLQGDALFGQKQYRRALNIYKQAFQHFKSIPRHVTSNFKGHISTSTCSPTPNSQSSLCNETEVKFKMALCYSALSEHRYAVQEIEGIPPKARTLRMSLTLGKLYRITKNSRAAAACYKDCLRQCPYVFEAITALAELGFSSKEISLLFSQAPTKGGKLPNDYIDGQRWLTRYVEAQCCIASHEYKGGVDIYQELLQRFSNNVHILLEIAKVQAIIGRNDEAIMNFEKVRQIDPNVLTYMDEYAIILKSVSDYPKLSKLVHDMISIDPIRAETCVALAVLWEKKDERKALSYAEKSLRIDDRHMTGYIIKGNLCLSLNRPDGAITAFRGAQELHPDFRALQGLVRAYLALSKYKEALYHARDAMKIMPHSAKAVKLVGDVYASSSTGRDKARKFFESALRLEPGFLGAVISLADLHVAEGRIKEAVILLEKYIRNWADDSLHVKLAQALASANSLSDALSHYQAALRINPLNEAAKKGLERLEKQMKGMDPDAPEDDEEHEAEDMEGDPEDTDLI